MKSILVWLFQVIFESLGIKKMIRASRRRRYMRKVSEEMHESDDAATIARLRDELL